MSVEVDHQRIVRSNDHVQSQVALNKKSKRRRFESRSSINRNEELFSPYAHQQEGDWQCISTPEPALRAEPLLAVKEDSFHFENVFF